VKRLVLIALLAGCHGKNAPVGGGGAADAVFYVKSNVPTAGLFVDGRFIGPVGGLKGGVAVVPGKHRLELRQDDYFSRYIELDMKKADRKHLEIELAPVLP
jgi:hypothetical protein